jgi:hypothetical protein
MATTDLRYLVAFTFGNPTQSALNGIGDADATLKLADTHWLATAARGDLEVISGAEFGVRYVDLLLCALKVYPVDAALGAIAKGPRCRNSYMRVSRLTVCQQTNKPLDALSTSGRLAIDALVIAAEPQELHDSDAE